jgi:primase-polymerase (primpol)-like protein
MIWPVFKPYADQERWLDWRLEPHKDSGKPTKMPYQARSPSQKAKSDDPSTWATLPEALRAYHNTPDLGGVGFCLLPGELIAFDLDNCVNPETKIPHPWVKDLVARAGSYTEITPSGRGLRIIGRGTGDRVYKIQKVDAKMGNCESYRRCEKYITITGNLFPGPPMVFADLDAIMDSVVTELDGRRAAGAGNSEEAEAEDGTGASAAEELPRSLVAMLHVPNTGASKPHGGYDTRSELMFAFIMAALRAGVSAKTIAKECLNPVHAGHAIFEHCRSEGGRENRVAIRAS